MRPRLNFYKPLKKADAGSAFQFSYSTLQKAIFVEAAPQKGEKLEIGDKRQFDWQDGKITFKVGVPDVGKLLTVFSGHNTTVKCIHAPDNLNYTSVLELSKGEYQGRPNFSLKLSKTIQEAIASKETFRVSMFLTPEEIGLLAHFVRQALTLMMGFQEDVVQKT